MLAIFFVIGLFTVCVGGCYLIFNSLGEAIFPSNPPKEKPPIVHNHYYHNEQHLHITPEELKKLIDTSRNRRQSE